MLLYSNAKIKYGGLHEEFNYVDIAAFLQTHQDKSDTRIARRYL